MQNRNAFHQYRTINTESTGKNTYTPPGYSFFTAPIFTKTHNSPPKKFCTHLYGILYTSLRNFVHICTEFSPNQKGKKLCRKYGRKLIHRPQVRLSPSRFSSKLALARQVFVKNFTEFHEDPIDDLVNTKSLKDLRGSHIRCSFFVS